MPEILTESFCERCGTRYTFQSSAPKVGRLAKMKVLSRGLKNYVLSDETSLDEALADARGVDDREHSVEQLDAFHKTFNFCMSCRQYTCANCWNEREGRCLSCAPSLSVGLLPSSSPTLNPIAGMSSLAANGHNHAGNGSGDLQLTAGAWPDADLGIAPDAVPLAGTDGAEEKPVSRLEALFGREEAARIKANAPAHEDDEPHPVPEMIGLEARSKTPPTPTTEVAAIAQDVDAVTETEDVHAPDTDVPPVLETFDADAETEAVAAQADEIAAVAKLEADEADEAVAAVAATETAEAPDLEVAAASDDVADEVEAEPIAAIVAEPVVPTHPIDPETKELAAAAAAQTHGLLGKFRARPVVIPEPEPILSTPVVPQVTAPSAPAPAGLPYAAVGPQGAPPAARPMPAIAQPFGVIGRPASDGAPSAYPAQPAMPYAAQAPQPYGLPAPAQYPAPIGQPYPSGAATIQPYLAPTLPQPPSAPAMYPPVQPQYASPPQQPQYAPPPAPSWRMVAPESPYVAPADPGGNGHVYGAPPPAPAGPEPQWPGAPSWPAPVPPASRTRGAEAVWAESTRDLLSRPETGVSACFNCGLPLSATARFCRRCGNSQVSA